MMPWYLGNGREFVWGPMQGFGIGLLALWSVAWTGLSLWHAARRQDTGWFIFFLLIHTAGIVEFIYLMFIAKVFASSTKHTPRRRK